MPEQITKYPDVTLKVLKEAGAACGQGAPQKILKKCPADRFCSLPTGEMCIYGMNEIPKMTQITQPELARFVCPKAQQSSVFGLDAMIFGAVFVVGLALGRFSKLIRLRMFRGRH
jgi:hypothetical protein